MSKKTKKRPMRILFSSNAPWSTSGYGTQVYDLLPMMRDAGYEVGIVCFYGLEGQKIKLDGITCYPKISDQWGGDAVVAHQAHFGADTVMTLQDIWVLNPNYIKDFKNWVPIVPIDHDPVPPAVFERLKAAYRVVTYSQFGHDELKRNGMHSSMIPHGVDTSILKAQPKAEIRKMIGIPEDMFLFGMVAANKDNPPRKSFQRAMDAFALFKKDHPNSGMYFHTLMQQDGGFPIKDYARFLGIEKDLFEIPPYDLLYNVDREGMAKIYSTFDCLLLPSCSEGFGVPAIEAQACGVPVIVNDFTAMPELIKDGTTGFKSEVEYKRFTPLGSYVGDPSVSSIYEAMKKVYGMDRVQAAKDSAQWVRQNYDSKKIFKEKWLPFLKKLEAELVD